MPRLVLGSLVLVGMAACSGDSGSVDAHVVDVPPDQVAECSADLSITGTFTPGSAVDPAMGCQPDGSWAIAVTVASMGNCSTVPVEATYNYTVTGTGRQSAVQREGAVACELDDLTISGDNGLCTGNFDQTLQNADGTSWDEFELHMHTPPFSQGSADASPRTLTGSGTYNHWPAPSFACPGA